MLLVWKLNLSYVSEVRPPVSFAIIVEPILYVSEVRPEIIFAKGGQQLQIARPQILAMLLFAAWG
jgi:hypothetical protein